MRVNSNLVTWSSTYSVGIKVIDNQHKGLLNLVNDMYNHVVNDEAAERAYFKKIIHEAVDYVKVHFATEERIMLAARFKGYAEHKRAHDSFILTVVDNIREFEAGKKINLSSFTHFLRDWILTHIAIMDKQYFEYFMKIATRKDNGRLSITAEDIAC
jgi:hemerythrin